MWVRGEARPRRIAGYAPTASTTSGRARWPNAQAVVGQVEPRLGTTITRANMWLVQAPVYTEQCVWDVIVLAAIAAMETGRSYMAASLRRGGDQGEPSLEARVELAVRGARWAVIDFWVSASWPRDCVLIKTMAPGSCVPSFLITDYVPTHADITVPARYYRAKIINYLSKCAITRTNK